MAASRAASLFVAVSMLGTLVPLGAGAVERSPAEMIAHGRYLVKVAGCNDCHTPGYMLSDGNVPEERWLLGDTFGWHGPWGTTYGSNLRLFLQGFSEDEWVEEAKVLQRQPPMPWFNLNTMKDEDLRAIYRFVRSLGDPGAPAPAALPPGQQPNGPFASFPAPPK